MEKSLLEYGYDVMSASKQPIKFIDLFNESLKLSGLEFSGAELKTQMAKFYTRISLDGRFVTLTDNYWDLRDRHVFDEVHLDMTDAYSDDEDEEADDEEEQKLLREELGEVEEIEEEESDDIDFDKPIKDADDEDF